MRSAPTFSVLVVVNEADGIPRTLCVTGHPPVTRTDLGQPDTGGHRWLSSAVFAWTGDNKARA